MANIQNNMQKNKVGADIIYAHKNLQKLCVTHLEIRQENTLLIDFQPIPS